MPLVGLEPTRRKTPVPKTGTSTIPSQRHKKFFNIFYLVYTNIQYICRYCKMKTIYKIPSEKSINYTKIFCQFIYKDYIMPNKNFFFTLKNLIQINFKKISIWVFLLFFAFSCGNIFGMYTKNINNFYIYILINIVVVEIISFIKYSRTFQLYEKYISNDNFLTKSFNVLKRGFLIGIFVEAFKVGS